MASNVCKSDVHCVFREHMQMQDPQDQALGFLSCLGCDKRCQVLLHIGVEDANMPSRRIILRIASVVAAGLFDCNDAQGINNDAKADEDADQT